jgi:hypothetical protein
MPPPDRRRRYEDDEDDRDDYPPQRQGMSPAWIVVIVVGGVSLLGLMACAGIGLLGFWAAPVNAPANPGAVAVNDPAVIQPADGKVRDSKRVYTRQEFRDLVMGKTEDEVIAAVGKPDEVSEDGEIARWTYRDRVRDAAGKAAVTPVVVFRDGKAVEVQY